MGAGVTDLKPGDRVAYGAAPIGAYAEARLIPADRLLKLPDGIDDKTAAAMMLKGLTTQYLIRQTYRVKAGDTILLHAAAGGVGLILGAMGQASRRHRDRHRRQRREGKTRAGAWLRPHHRLHPRGFREARRRDHRRQEGAGGVRLRRQGHFPEIARLPGAARLRSRCSASPPATSSRSTSACWRQKGSLYVTRPTLNTYAAKRENLVAMAKELFEVVQSGAVKIEVHQTYPLKDAAKAHADLAARKTTGSTVLMV